MPDFDEKYPRIAFRAGKVLGAALEQRVANTGVSPDSIAKRDLERYYTLLRKALLPFSEAEASLLVDVLNGSLCRPETASLLWAEVETACRDGGHDTKWAVDGPALVVRLRSLTPFECMAIEDAVERFWLGSYRQDKAISERLRAVGLVVD